MEITDAEGNVIILSSAFTGTGSLSRNWKTLRKRNRTAWPEKHKNKYKRRMYYVGKKSIKSKRHGGI